MELDVDEYVDSFRWVERLAFFAWAPCMHCGIIVCRSSSGGEIGSCL